MRLENVLALTHGKLVNSPFINDFVDIIFEVRAVKRGDLFIAFNEDDIEMAIFNGAYGVIFDKPTQISDSEIAWIQVNNNEDALKRLLRFRLIEKNIIVYECDEITLKLAQQIITEPTFIVMQGNMKNIAKILWHIVDGTTILFSPSLNDRNIFTDTKILPHTNVNTIRIIEHTLFETSFIYDNIFYERQIISPFFIPYLQKILNLLKLLKINYRLKKFTSIENFEPIFINNNFEIKEFGTSDKVLIFENNNNLIEKEIKFLKQNANWAKIIYVFPKNHTYKLNSSIFTYKNNLEVIQILKNNNFNFALILGINKSILDNLYVRQAQLTLEF